jgi:hypothetical protein
VGVGRRGGGTRRIFGENIRYAPASDTFSFPPHALSIPSILKWSPLPSPPLVRPIRQLARCQTSTWIHVSQWDVLGMVDRVGSCWIDVCIWDILGMVARIPGIT